MIATKIAARGLDIKDARSTMISHLLLKSMFIGMGGSGWFQGLKLKLKVEVLQTRVWTRSIIH